MKKRHSYELALSAICTGLLLLFLWLSTVVQVGTVSFFIICAGILMVPMTKKYYWTTIFAYIASSLLAFAVVGNIFKILGFVAYFGPFTFLSILFYEKKLKWWIAYPIKILYINGILAIFYFLTDLLLVNLSSYGFAEVHYAVIALLGTMILLLLDFAMLYIYKYIKIKFDKIIKD